jgi:hypothetical protein
MAEQTAKMAKSHGVGRLGWGRVGLIGVQLGLGGKGSTWAHRDRSGCAPLVHHLDQATEPRARPSAQPIPAPCPRDRLPRAPAWVGAGSPHVDPTPCGATRVPIKPTRPRPRQQTSCDSIIFRSSLSHFDKGSGIFEFSVDHFATSLLQCSAIFILVLIHF